MRVLIYDKHDEKLLNLQNRSSEFSDVSQIVSIILTYKKTFGLKKSLT